MKKANIIGIVILVVIVAGGLVFKFATDSGKTSEGPSSTSGTSGDLGVFKAVFKPLVAPAVQGLIKKTVQIDGKDVPLISIPLDTWGGYALLFTANKGSEPNKDSLFYKLGGFAVKLVIESSSQKQLEGYAQGQWPIVWSTMDNVPIMAQAFKTDKRASPKVLGIFDWSDGGDGIVVRSSVKDSRDLKGKTIITSGNTPNNFFLLWLLGQNNIKTTDVSMLFIPDAETAVKTFAENPSIDGIVTWEPYVGALTKAGSASAVNDARVLITSGDANQLIADVYVARADFVRDNKKMAGDFSLALLTAYDEFKANPAATYGYMASFYKLTGGTAEAEQMLQRVHLANFPETQMFFGDESGINAAKIFYMAQGYYKEAGSLGSDSSLQFESYIEKSFITDFASKKLFGNQKNLIEAQAAKQADFNIDDLESQRVVLVQDSRIYFDPQKIDFDIDKDNPEMKENRRLLQNIAGQMEILGTTVVKLIGHLDTSKVEEFKSLGKQQFIEASAQAHLISKRRAEFVKSVLVKNYKVDASRIFTEGRGWDEPTSDQPELNRRVEIQFVSFE